MAVAESYRQITHSASQKRETVARSWQSGAASVIRILVAGMVASKEYRHLNGMTDRQLAALGLSRSEIDREIRQRHFSALGGSFARGAARQE